MRRICYLLILFFIAFLPFQPAAQAQDPTLVDALLTPQSLLQVNAITTSASGTATGLDILGGERDVLLTYGSGVGGQAEISTNTSVFGLNGLEFTAVAGSNVTLQIAYDGVDGDPNTLNPVGLGGFDLTNSDQNDTITAPVVSAGDQTQATFTVYTDATHCSIASFTLPDPVDPPGGLLFASFSDALNMFVTCPGAAGPADFTSIGALVLVMEIMSAETRPVLIPSGSGAAPVAEGNAPAALGGGITVVPLAALPVELATFEAVRDGRAVLLTWSTLSETNNAGFEVQRKQGGAFEALAFVEGAGTTTEARAYAYRAETLAPGLHVFRLKQVDYDGAFTYSAEVEVAVDVPGTHVLTAAYPNPFNPQTRFTLTLQAAQPVTVAVFDMLGREVTRLFDGSMEAGTAYSFVLDGSKLPSGLYLYRVTGATFSESRVVTLMK